MDRIFITDLRVDAVIGILAHERTAPQPLMLDLEPSADIRTPAASDDIADALDHEALSDGVREFVAASEELPIETLAAGAMLTMIAETMLPEAFEEGGSITGITTLCGFLTALAVASL